MNSNDPNFGDCLFKLTNLMRAKGDVGIISDIISEAIKIHKQDHCQTHSNESPSLGIDPPHDDVEHGYYDEDDDSDFDLDDAMRHFGLMANLRGYMGKFANVNFDFICKISLKFVKMGITFAY